MSLRYAVPASQPAPVAFDRALPHTVTQTSLERSWDQITSPKKTRGLTPSDYSKQVQAEFNLGESAKRFEDLRQATGKISLSSTQEKRLQENEALLASVAKARTGYGQKHGQATRRALLKAADPFRPNMIPHEKPPLISPYRTPTTTRQRQNYIYSSPLRIPNPALPPNGDPAYPPTKFFPYNARPTHHTHAINPQVNAGYFATHWDDRHFHNPYQQYEVQIVETARPHGDGAESASAPSPSSTREEKNPLSPSAFKPNASSLGFGQRHPEFFQYIHHSQNGVIPRTSGGSSASSTVRMDGPSLGVGNGAQTIRMPLSTHLLDGQPASAISEATARGLALEVPLKLARFVPMDTRDADGKRGHLNASGLGYGRGHRNHHKYIFDNREGNAELAYFRSNHCT